MWKDYSADFIKNNRAASLTVRIPAFISALLLSLLCGLFYNAWKYEVERIKLEEGGWQSRIIGELNEEQIESIKNYATVKNVAADGKVTEIYFDHYRDALSDTPCIVRVAGILPEKVEYHDQLLSMYLIRRKGDTAPRLIFPMFLLITALASLSLIIIIHNSFAVSMNARIRQFGIFSSIGATPGQIRTCLFQEAVVLCTVPILAGNLLGIGGSMGLVGLSNILLENQIPGRHKAIPGYHPLVLAPALLVTVITIWISVWLPARKLSRLTPLEAIKNTGELELKRKKKSGISALLFGVEGELAANALKAQSRSLRTASLALIFSFLAFTVMQCFFTISGISTRETYFEKYQDAWDIMVTLKDTDIDGFEKTKEIQELPGVESAVVYQKATAKRKITEEEISEEMRAFGGFSHAPAHDVARIQGGWLVNAPIIILDDVSFLDYCRQIGIQPQLDGAIIRNKIRDVTNPDFRHPKFVPYLKEENISSAVMETGNENTAEIPVLAYTGEVPVLREEYATLDYYELVHFIPVSLWKELKEQIGGMEKDTCIRVLGKENVALEELNTIQNEIHERIGFEYTVKCENRIQDYETNNIQIQGMKVILGSFCVLLGIIGAGNVFSNTLGFAGQRKREFARYLSVGMTPEEIRKMFYIEALVLAIRPILRAFPLAVIAVGYMLKISYLAAGEFLAEAPFFSIAVFILAIFGAVALAYYFAWKNVGRINLTEVLKDDSMM